MVYLDGAYKVVNLDRIYAPLADTEMAISGNIFDAPKYAYKGIGVFQVTSVGSMWGWPWQAAEEAQVTVDQGKIKVEIPQNICTYALPVLWDSIYMHGVIQED
jgi:hypothetical protein